MCNLNLGRNNLDKIDSNNYTKIKNIVSTKKEQEKVNVTIINNEIIQKINDKLNIINFDENINKVNEDINI